MNPWSHQKQREKALQRYYDRVNPQPKKQEDEMAFDPYTEERRREQEYLYQQMQAMKQAHWQAQIYGSSYFYPDEPAKPLEKSASTECIIGLRVWKVVDDKGLPKLASVIKSSVLWPYRKALERDPIMAEGIHAVKPGDRVISLFHEYSGHVAGEVYLWGKVIECDGGYLGEFAYPKKLLVPSNFDAIKAMQLEDEYGVPCEYREELNPAETLNKTATGILMQGQQLIGSLYPQGLAIGLGRGLSWQP